MTYDAVWEFSGGLGFHLGQQHLVLAALLEGKQREREQRGGGRASARVRLRWPPHPFPSRREPCGPRSGLPARCPRHGIASWPHADLQGPNGYKDDWFLACQTEERRGFGTVVPKDFKTPLRSQGTEAESRHLCANLGPLQRGRGKVLGDHGLRSYKRQPQSTQQAEHVEKLLPRQE